MSLPTFTSTTTAEEVANTFSGEIQGKNVLITGTSLNGLGFEAARVIAKHANLVIITGYNVERLKLSEAAIKKDVPTANIRLLTFDLSSLAAVRKAAAEVDAYAEPLHVLVHNAASSPAGPFKLTPDGLEMQMATAHFGPFLLTKLLAPKLLASATAAFTPRVVIVSSGAQAAAGVDFTTLAKPDPTKYTSFGAYYQAKSANVLFAIELSKRFDGKIKAYSLHPGAVYTAGCQKEEMKAPFQAAGIFGPDGMPNPDKEWKTLAQGAATTVAAAFDTRIADKPGAYLVDCVEANAQIAPHNADPANAEKLWTLTEEIVGEKFTF
ncbi:hypothetical protein FB451DRAFT_1369962 [Mycena latifolia]|nr:hypothetical protein FB451DRAFT_1369962 [Mycena latifolia]